MRTLKDHVILYDDECPLCKVYTKAFVKGNLLPETGRACYQKASVELAGLIDKQRAANEIALINKRTGTVQYGVQSLFTIIGHAFPVFKPLFRFPPFAWLMNKAYAFISYNRRVIVPSTTLLPAGVQPSFKLPYRIAYLVFTWLLTSLVLSRYAPLLSGIIPGGPLFREYLVCGGQVIFQGTIAAVFFPKKKWDYLGNMMTISFAGALVLLPGFVLAAFFVFSPVFYTLYFLLVAGLMFLEHVRRTKLLQVGWMLTLTWVAYRMMMLFVITYLH